MEQSQLFVTIKSFHKYNPRTDVKGSSWLRLEHSLFDNHELFDFTPEEKMAWIYLLCLASKTHCDKVLINFSHVEKIGSFKKQVFMNALKKLESIQYVHVDVTDAVRGRNVDVTWTCATDERTNETNERICRFSINEFDEVYDKYPKKQGKQAGIKIMRRDIKTPEDLADLKNAIEKYSKHCRDQRLEPKYIKQFSTFMSSWRDWLDPKAGKVEFEKPRHIHPPVVSFAHEPFEEPFTGEQLAENRKRISELMKVNGLKPLR